jgi:hypothetical protein
MLDFYGLSAALKPIKILLKVCPYESDVAKLILFSLTGTLNKTFFDPFLFAYQSFIFSYTLVFELNFSMKSISFDSHEISLIDEADFPDNEANESKILFSISFFSPETKISESD